MYIRDLVATANDLRRISALQTEFGVFTSLETLDRPRCHACWSIMKEGLVGLEEHLHGGYEVQPKKCKYPGVKHVSAHPCSNASEGGVMLLCDGFSVFGGCKVEVRVHVDRAQEKWVVVVLVFIVASRVCR